MTTQEKLKIIVDAAEDVKAENVETLDVGKKTSVAEYFVVCTGTSDRHVDSIADRVAERLRDHKVKPLRVEGDRTGWILHDYGEIILHVMRDEQRQFYDLESLWNSMQPNPDLVD